MRISIVTSGSRGDIQPYIALGKGLKASGHEVKIVTNENFEDFVKSHGLDFYPITVDLRDILESEVGMKLLESGYSYKFIKMFSSLMSEHIEILFHQLLDSLEDTEFIIFSAVTFIAYHIAKKKGVKCIAAYLQPVTPTNEFQSIMFPDKLNLLPFYNKLSHYVFQQAIWQTIRTTINKLMIEKLESEKIPFLGDFNKLYTLNQVKKEQLNIVYGYSPYIIPKPLDWSHNIDVTGYWFLNSDKNEKLSPELENFLDTDKKVVYIGFGSMRNRDTNETARVVLNVIKRLDVKAIIMTGWGGFKDLPSDENISVVESVPHDLIFPRMSAVVHHCGAGTTSAGLKAGVPTVPIPFFADQPFWATKLYRLNVASKPIDRKDMNETNLYEALKTTLTDESISKKASYIGKIIRAEDGVKRAVDIINEKILKS